MENLKLAYKKASKGKSKKLCVMLFKKRLNFNLRKLEYELKSLTYKPQPLNNFVVRDPKTRIIHSSAFRDRVVHHALINVIEPIFDKSFIFDSYANRKTKGTLKAVQRFDKFKRKISKNGRLVRNNLNNNQVIGYVLKCDVRHYFEEVDHKILIQIIKRKIKDEKVIWLTKQILNNFSSEIIGKGMPLGNLTSQFFANVYLNELDKFIKYKLRIKYYIRYVDDFVILHTARDKLERIKRTINRFLKTELNIELHKDKSKLIPLRNTINFLGYRIFYHYKLLKKNNIKKFNTNFGQKIKMYKAGLANFNELIYSLYGWLGYAKWANAYRLRNELIRKISTLF